MQLPQLTTSSIPGAATGLQALAGLVNEGAGKLDALNAGDGKALAALIGQIPGQDGEAPSGEQGQAFAEALAAILSMATAGAGAEVSPKADPAAAKTTGSSTLSPALLMQAIRDALGLDPQAEATAPDAAQTAKAASAATSTAAPAIGGAATPPAPAPAPTGASAPAEHPDVLADTQPQPAPPTAAAPVAVAAAAPPTTPAVPDSAPETMTAPTVSAAASADADLAAEMRPGEKPQTRGDIRRAQKASADPAAAAAAPQAGLNGSTTRSVTPVEGKPDADAAGLQLATTEPAPSAEAETDASGNAPTAPLPPAVNASAQTPAMPKAEPATFVHLASQIVQKLNAKVTRFDLELLPAGLGKVDVKIEITPSGQLTAALSCDNPHAAAELKGRAEELRSALQQAGFNLSDSGLSFDFNGQQQRWAQDRREDARAFAGKAFAAAVDKADDLLASVAEAAARLDRRAASGGLDLRI